MTDYSKVAPIDKDELRAARKAVARGVALLDKEGPDNWRDRVVAEQLDMGSTQRCVLGQTFARAFSGSDESGYDYGVTYLGQTEDWLNADAASGYQSEYFGFEQSAYDQGFGEFHYPALGRAWEEELFPELFSLDYEQVEDLIDAKLGRHFAVLKDELPGLVTESVRSVLRSL